MKAKTYISEELKPIFEKESSYVRHFIPDLEIRMFPNATVMPSRGWKDGLGGVLDDSGGFIPSSTFTQGSEKVYEFSTDDVTIRHESVIFLGVFHHCWGHAMTDNLRHSWIFLNSYNEILNEKCIYVTVDNKPLHRAVVDLFALVGIDILKAELVTELTCFDKVYIPDECIVNNEYGALWSPEYKLLIDRIKNNVSIPQDIVANPKLKKIYFTRTQLPQSTRDIGEWTIEKVFKSLGYTIVAPEKLSVLTQLQLLMNCDAFAATEGSIAHNAIFTKPHTSVSLILKASYFNPYQWMANDMAQVDCTYIEAQNSFRLFDVSYGPFLMIKSKYLCEYAGIKYDSFSIEMEFSRILYKYPILAKIRKKLSSIFCKYHNPL